MTLLVTACSQQHSKKSLLSLESDSSIVNGRPVRQDDSFRFYTVSVGPKEEPQCTGVIVGEHHILTAAHCVEVIEGTFVHFGLDFSSPKSIRLPIKNVIGHPKYCPTCTEDITLGDTADIALVEVDGSLPPGYQSVNIAAIGEAKPGMTITLAGFGANERGAYETGMKVTHVPLDKVGTSEFATDETKAGSCNGDSGGPAYIQIKGEYRLLGITSRGDARCRKVGIYTMPDAYQNWILDILTTPEN